MAKRIYTIIAVIALVILIYLLVNPHSILPKTLLVVVSFFYAVLVGSVHGVLAYSLSSKQKGTTFLYPVMMGMSFAVFIFIYIYLIVPAVIPGYMIK